MKKEKSYRFDKHTHAGEIDEPSICPMCKNGMSPTVISEYPYKEDLNLDNMKDFIKAAVYFISMSLLVEKASSITPG